MREAVVKSSLNLEEVLSGFEESNVALGEGLESLLCVCVGGMADENGRHPHNGGPRTKDGGEHLGAHDDVEVVLVVLDEMYEEEGRKDN